MGNFGSVIGALLEGAAQGYLEEQADDKGRVRLKKEQDAANKRETAKSVLDNPDLRPEARTATLAFLSGQGGQAEKAFDLLMSTGEVSATRSQTASALPQAQLPSISLNGEGKINRNQPQVFSSETGALPQIEGPPAPTAEALNREVTSEITEELPIFLSAQEKRTTAMDLRRELASEDRKEELLLDTQRQEQTFAGLQQFIETLELDPQSPIGPALRAAARLASEGRPELFNDLVSRHFSPGENQAEILAFIASLDLQDKDLTNAEVLRLAEATLPLVFASMPGARAAVLSQIKSARRMQALAIEETEVGIALKKAQAVVAGLTERIKLNTLMGDRAMAGHKPKDINTFIGKTSDIISSVTKAIVDITLKQDKDDPISGKISEGAWEELQIIKNVHLARLDDLEFRRDQAIDRKEQLFADDEESAAAAEEALLVGPGGVDFGTMNANSPRVIKRIATLMAELTEDEAAPFLAEMMATDDPEFALSESGSAKVLELAEIMRGKRFDGTSFGAALDPEEEESFVPGFVQRFLPPLPTGKQPTSEQRIQEFLQRHPEVLPLLGGQQRKELKDFRIQLPNFGK